MKIEVGEYVRTKEKGIIGKIEQIGVSLLWLEDGSALKIKEQSYKHSKNIIDLIEVGDYVNGKLIHKIDKGQNYCYLYYGNCKTFADYQIKTIITKEQMSSIEYKVEEDK